MKSFPVGTAVALALCCVFLPACDGETDTSETDDGTEGTEGTEVAVFETGVDVFGLAGEADITFSDGAASTYSGTTAIVDRALGDGPLGSAGDVLCQYIYPATGTPYALTQDGLDSDNNEVTVTCEGCEFGFELTHAAPTVAGEGPYCELWYAETNWDTDFPVAAYTVAYHPSFDLPDTDDVESTGAVLQFYDGLGDVIQYDDEGNEVEAPAQWFASGPATLENDTLQWTQIIDYYDVFEIGYYE